MNKRRTLQCALLLIACAQQAPKSAKSCPTDSELDAMKLECREQIVAACGASPAEDCPTFVECKQKARDWQDCQ